MRLTLGASPLLVMVVFEQSTIASAVPPRTDTPNGAFGLAVNVNVATTSIWSEPVEWTISAAEVSWVVVYAIRR